MNILDNGIHLAQTMSFDQLDTCLDLITFNGAKTLNIEDQYGIEAGKPANFLVLDATTPFLKPCVSVLMCWRRSATATICSRSLNPVTRLSWISSDRLDKSGKKPALTSTAGLSSEPWRFLSRTSGVDAWASGVGDTSLLNV